MSQRLSLDRPTFERLLAAASLVQQMQNQSLRITFNSTDSIGLLGLVETQQAIQTGALDLEAACFQVTSLALRLTGAQGAGVWLFTQDTFAYRAGAGTASKSERLRLAVLAGLAGTEPASDVPDLGDSIRCSKAKSLLVAPIYQGPKVSGALAVFSEEQNVFSDRDAANSRLLAGILAHAVDKAAEAELKHSVALERAAMQQVVERLIPSLMRLTGQDQEATPSSHSAGGHHLAETSLAAAPSLSPVVPGPAVSPEVVADLPAHQAEEILSSIGSLRRPERSFAREEELAETNPRWVESLNPGFDRWAPVGPAQCVSATIPVQVTPSALPSATSRPAAEKPALQAQEAVVIAPPTVLAPEPAPHVLPTVALQTAPQPAERANPKYDKILPFVIQTARSAAASLRLVPGFRLNVRFAFDYKPTMRALGVGLAAVLLSGVAFLMLRSGETTVNTSLAAGSDALHANTAESSVGQSVPVPASQATAPAVARAARSKPPRRKKARPQPTVAENSHLRITDSRASTALSGLSRYEILSLRRKAEYGDDSAAFVLGMAYEVGHGVPRSCSQAAKWVTVAAQQGNAAAEYNLSLRYRTADGVRANPDEAEKWFRKAARKRYAHAGPALTAAKLEDSHSAGQPYR